MRHDSARTKTEVMMKQEMYDFLSVNLQNLLAEYNGLVGEEFEKFIKLEVENSVTHLERIKKDPSDISFHRKEVNAAVAHILRANLDFYKMLLIVGRLDKPSAFFNDRIDHIFERKTHIDHIKERHEHFRVLIDELLTIDYVSRDITEIKELIQLLNLQYTQFLSNKRFYNDLRTMVTKQKLFIISYVIAVVSAILSLYSTIVSVPRGSFRHIFGFASTSVVFAATQNINFDTSNTVQYKPLVSLLFTLSVLVAFFGSFLVSLHNDSPAKRQTAKGYANLMAGILIGSAKNFLGL